MASGEPLFADARQAPAGEAATWGTWEVGEPSLPFLSRRVPILVFLAPEGRWGLKLLNAPAPQASPGGLCR